MELRACEDISMAQDITLQIHPLAFALSHSMHHSRCSACFSPLTINTNNNGHLDLSCNSCKNSVSYCSQACYDADLHCHQSSGECCLFGILRHNPNSHWSISNSSDLRVALRLLRSFELLGFLTDKSSDVGSSRIGGLMSNREKLFFEQFDDDQSERIREGARIMSLARKMGSGGIETGEENLVMEETVLCLVITNGVEVLVDEGSLVQVDCLSLGTAVYGPLFSWCNHSCRPNACYRFCLTTPSDFETGLGGYCRIMPQGKESMPSNTWIGRDGSKLSSGNCKYGPCIILRSIRPILKGEEVCIAYTDLLQPKVKRRSELWLKYRFVCCCDRCISSPSTYADRVLQESATSLEGTSSSLDHSSEDEKYWEISNYIEKAVTEYMEDGNPEACCQKLETLLTENCQVNQLRPGDLSASPPTFNLHLLHHLSLDAYTILASAYRVRASCINLDPPLEYNQLKAFNFSREDAAYSLLLAGATHHLFLSESSLILTVARFWLTAGESLLNLVRSSSNVYPVITPNSRIGSCLLMKQSMCLARHGGGKEQREGSDSWTKFCEISKDFLDCVAMISSRIWDFLNRGFHFLETIKNPVEFSWLGLEKACQQEVLHGIDHLSDQEGLCDCISESDRGIKEEKMRLFQLAAHCLVYGGYLTKICYGSHHPLVDFVGNLLFGGENLSVLE